MERPSGTAAGEVVPHVDLTRYLGTWYEIATIPQRFQKGCVAVTAEYSLRDDGDIRVVNTCRQDTFDGPIRQVRGKARVTDPLTNAKLKVTFFWPFSGPYWIIGLDPDYRWAIVGNPKKSALWILSRSPVMDDRLYEGLLWSVAGKGYAVDKIKRTPQPVSGMSAATLPPRSAGAGGVSTVFSRFPSRSRPAWMNNWTLIIASLVVIGGLFLVYAFMTRRSRG
jgi:apolipoprotein D and lipocalin family protein